MNQSSLIQIISIINTFEKTNQNYKKKFSIKNNVIIDIFFSNVFQQSNKRNVAQNIKNISLKDTQIILIVYIILIVFIVYYCILLLYCINCIVYYKN